MADPVVDGGGGGGGGRFLGAPREDLAWGLQAVATWRLLEDGDADALRYAAGVPAGARVPLDDVVAPPAGRSGQGTAVMAGLPTWAWVVGGLAAGSALVLLVVIAARS